MVRTCLWSILRGNVGLLMAGLLLAHGATAQTGAVPPSAPAAVRPPAQRTRATPPPTAAPAPDAAGLTLARTIALPRPGPASLDRKGNLYVTDAQNNLRQFSPDGTPLAVYSPPLPGHTAQVEAWNSTKILVFYDDRQELQLLDRFMAPIGATRLNELTNGGLIRVATLAPDDNLWLLDESNLTLNQLGRGQQQRYAISTPLDLLLGRTRPDFRFLREYQNNLYLVDYSSGVWVFDNLGNYRKRLPFAGLNWIGFRGDELYYVRDGQLRFFHLYGLQERAMPLPVPAAMQVLVGEKHVYSLTPAGLSVHLLP